MHPVTLAQRTALKAFLAALFRRERCALASLHYIFCDDKYLLDINQRFLQHDDYTDIITFNLSAPGDKAITGEVYISTERVRDNARQLGVSFKEELHRVIFHGALHLCGYKDKSAKDQQQMRQKEEAYLGLYFGQR
jgi:rRNA maturation RNase YbeY